MYINKNIEGDQGKPAQTPGILNLRTLILTDGPQNFMSNKLQF